MTNSQQPRPRPAHLEARAPVLPGLARAVVRRAERHAVRARACGRPVGDEVLRYLNWLSVLLFVLARHAAGGAEEPASHD